MQWRRPGYTADEPAGALAVRQVQRQRVTRHLQSMQCNSSVDTLEAFGCAKFAKRSFAGCSLAGSPSSLLVPSMHLASQVAAFVLVSLLWGCTNPFLRHGSERTAPAKRTGRIYVDAPRAVIATLSEWRFALPFAVNQLGSVLFNVLLGSARLSLAVPIVSALTAVFTGMTAAIVFKEQQHTTPFAMCGATLVLLGVVLCATSQLD